MSNETNFPSFPGGPSSEGSPNPKKEIITVDDLCQIFLRHERTIMRWVATGYPPQPAIHVGKKAWVFDELMDYLRQRQREDTEAEKQNRLRMKPQQ